MLSVVERNPIIKQLVVNDWVQLAVLDPNSTAIQLYHNGRFEPYRMESSDLPIVHSSVDWYRGWRDHLGYASIVPSSAPGVGRSPEALA